MTDLYPLSLLDEPAAREPLPRLEGQVVATQEVLGSCHRLATWLQSKCPADAARATPTRHRGRIVQHVAQDQHEAVLRFEVPPHSRLLDPAGLSDCLDPLGRVGPSLERPPVLRAGPFDDTLDLEHL